MRGAEDSSAGMAMDTDTTERAEGEQDKLIENPQKIRIEFAVSALWTGAGYGESMVRCMWQVEDSFS